MQFETTFWEFALLRKIWKQKRQLVHFKTIWNYVFFKLEPLRKFWVQRRLMVQCEAI